MQVIWKYLFKASSFNEVGTLYQLRNVLNRSNVVYEPKNDYNACSDFFETIVESHVIAAVMETFQMTSMSDTPRCSYFPDGFYSLSEAEQRTVLQLAVKQVVAKHVCVQFNPQRDQSSAEDGIMQYARELLSLGLLFLNFHDAIREGDGERVFLCWKFFFPIFMAAGRTKYTIEAFSMMCQRYYLFSERQVKQLMYSRFINTSGLPHQTFRQIFIWST